MCGRFQIATDPRPLLDALGVAEADDAREPFAPRWNVAPSDPPRPEGSTSRAPRRLTRVPVCRSAEGRRHADSAIWPLVPVWARGEVPKYSTANARVETMAEKASFRHAWNNAQRCLVLASGFYEWQDSGERTKQPWCIKPLNDGWFTFGGLWERSRAADGTDVLSCTIVTMPANELMREIHNAGKNRHRMPLILDGDARDAWLDGDEGVARAAIAVYPADEMRAWPVSRAVNNPGHDDPDVEREVGVGSEADGR